MILMWLASAALSSGVLYDNQGFRALASLDLTVTVDGRIATGTARYGFAAANGPQTLVVALPDGAAVSSLRAWIDGAWITAGASPGLQPLPPAPGGPIASLLPGDLFFATLPDPLGAPVEIEVVWQDVLSAASGSLSLEIPLADGGLNPSDPVVTLSADLAGNSTIQTVSSNLGSANTTDTGATATASEPLSDLDHWALAWTEAPLPFGVEVRAFRPEIDPFTGEVDPDGYALVTLVPGAPDPAARVDAIYTFVLDASASMQGRPMNTAVAAASTWLLGLDDTDRFNLVPYTSVAIPFRGRAPRATDGAVSGAIRFLERQRPAGLSDPTDGLVTAISLLDDTVQQRPQ